MESPAPTDLSLTIEALLGRLDREVLRLGGVAPPSTEIVGGWAKIGGLLDALLRNAFLALALAGGHSPDRLFAQATGQPSWTLQHASAGQLRGALARAAAATPTGDPRVASLAADPRGALAAVIALRNDAVHGRPLPDAATQRDRLAALRAWLATMAALPAAPGRSG